MNTNEYDGEVKNVREKKRESVRAHNFKVHNMQKIKILVSNKKTCN